jgi:dihydrodipicolinate synthase/N-acetylneuraminate lyase
MTLVPRLLGAEGFVCVDFRVAPDLALDFYEALLRPIKFESPRGTLAHK